MNVSLRLLRAFLAVGQEGNVGRAAARMLVSQPALSQDIRRLERAIGTNLFERGAHGMRLTDAGEVLFADVADAVALLDRGVERACAAAGSQRKTVVLSFTPSISHRLIPALRPALDRVPTVAVDEREVDTGEVVPGVLAGRFDLGLAHCPPADPRLHSTPMGNEPMCVAIAADHPLAQAAAPVSLASLRGLSLLLWSRDVALEYYDHVLGLCASAGFEPVVVPGPRRTLLRPYVLRQGDVFCLLPMATASLNVPGVAFVPVADRAATVPLTLMRRADDQRPEVLATEAAATSAIRELGFAQEASCRTGA